MNFNYAQNIGANDRNKNIENEIMDILKRSTKTIYCSLKKEEKHGNYYTL